MIWGASRQPTRKRNASLDVTWVPSLGFCLFRPPSLSLPLFFNMFCWSLQGRVPGGTGLHTNAHSVPDPTVWYPDDAHESNVTVANALPLRGQPPNVGIAEASARSTATSKAVCHVKLGSGAVHPVAYPQLLPGGDAMGLDD